MELQQFMEQSKSESLFNLTCEQNNLRTKNRRNRKTFVKNDFIGKAQAFTIDSQKFYQIYFGYKFTK